MINSKFMSCISQMFIKPASANKANRLALLLATFFGTGYFKHAPGTFASIITILLGFILINISPVLLSFTLIFTIIIGFISADIVSAQTSENDPKYIVIDEVAGQLIPFLLLVNIQSVKVEILTALLVFVIFRILDIFKPWIIGHVEKRFKGGIGIMIDDILAGMITLLIVFLILFVI